MEPARPVLRLDRYVLFDVIAKGGMAAIHIGRQLGAAGFSRTVAVKRLHEQFCRDPGFVAMLVDEARLASRITHPNVVSPTDVVSREGELFLVMDYVAGDSLASLARTLRESRSRMDPAIAVRILCDTLAGLHAAHVAKSEDGELLGIVHRDVSPQNVLVGVDGVSRVLDFGIAKARIRLQTTREGQVKGKLRYMAPEQLRDENVSPRTDVYAAGVVLWELLTGERLFGGATPSAIVGKIQEGVAVAPSRYVKSLSEELDSLVLRAISRDPNERFGSAREMATALERALTPASSAAVGDCLQEALGDSLAERAARVAEIERRDDWNEAVPVAESVSTTHQSVGSGESKKTSSRAPALAILGLLGVMGIALVAWAVGKSSSQTTSSSAPSFIRPLVTETTRPEPIESTPVVSPAPPASSTSPTPTRVILGPKPKPKPNCNPPWTQDKNGFRTVKRECL